MIITIILLSMIGAIVLWDKLAIGEFGISQPIVACPLIGLCFGEFYIGLLLGGVLQLVWVGALPLGGKEPLDNQGAGVVAIATYIFATKSFAFSSPGKVMFVCLLFAGLASVIGQVAAQMLKQINNRLFVSINKQSSARSIIMTNFKGLVTSFLKSLVLIVIFQILFIIVSPLIESLPDFNRGELIIIPLTIGIAGLARLLIFKRRIAYSVLGVVTGIVLWVLLKY
jgi:PTS system N-acetylgalactosamine-specific IIC component